MTVDSGACETVVPPVVAQNLPLIHISRVGTEYTVSSGGVVANLGEKSADVITKLGNTNSMIMRLQVVKVHKPLLAVSRLVEAGHQLHFDKFEPHILLTSGEKVPMSCRDGSYEIEMLIRKPDLKLPTDVSLYLLKLKRLKFEVSNKGNAINVFKLLYFQAFKV